MKWTNRLGKVVTVGGAWSTALLTVGIATASCLSRPVGKQPPTTKVNFTSTVSQQAVDKVDILFAIDNSQSMGDKQLILRDAVPDLINGLLRPKCVDADGKPNGQLADPAGNKANQYGCAPLEPEFKPVTDMHIGVVSSSLGNFGGDVCEPRNARTNDRARLLNINREAGGAPLEIAKPSNFLAWFPQAAENRDDAKRHPRPKNPIETITDLSAAFQTLVVGVDQTGCGLEAQLESVYRFLIQPDPWEVIKLDGNGLADQGDGVDTDLLQQRADFLRPDSLVAVIMLTDEDDSSADPLSIGGQGYAFMANKFPGSNVRRGDTTEGTTAPRATSACETNPASDDCTTCGFAKLCDASTAACQKIRQDPNCKESGQAGQSGEGYNGFYGAKDDEMNVRFHEMKRRYGVDPQYPIKRYVDGFTKFKVPDRAAEHAIKITKDKDGKEKREIANYTGGAKCTNPLFASRLPREVGEERCALPRSTRSPDLIFFAVVGGVPNDLLYPGGYDPNDQEKNRTTNEKWIKILGRDPLNFNLDGIDPHMRQSTEPRPGLTGVQEPRGSNGSDAYNGREWSTNKEDLQYACTFDLPKPKPCPTGESCDCAPTEKRNPPLCAGTAEGGAAGNTQVKAKAYPTIREFEVVRALGDQGVAASLCPIQLSDASSPTYGYRPAVAAIIDRLKNALTTQCLPQKLEKGGEVQYPCLVLAQLADPEKDFAAACRRVGLEPPKKEILEVFLEQQKIETGFAGDGGLDLAALPVCEVPQDVVQPGESCRDKADRKVWCYVENDPTSKKSPAGRCPQALIFSSGTAELGGARFSLQCIQQFDAGVAAGDIKK